MSDAQLSLTQAQADLAAAQPGNSNEDKLATLYEKESKLYEQYSRLAKETYSDVYYQDRLRLANSAFLQSRTPVSHRATAADQPLPRPNAGAPG